MTFQKEIKSIDQTEREDVTSSYLQEASTGVVIDWFWILQIEFDESIGNDKLFEKAIYKGGIMKIRGSLPG